MVSGLLLVIGVHGIEVFWPKPVVQIEVKPESTFKFMESKALAGEIVKRQAKILTDVKEREAAAAAGKVPTELQLYVEQGRVRQQLCLPRSRLGRSHQLTS